MSGAYYIALFLVLQTFALGARIDPSSAYVSAEYWKFDEHGNVIDHQDSMDGRTGLSTAEAHVNTPGIDSNAAVMVAPLGETGPTSILLHAWGSVLGDTDLEKYHSISNAGYNDTLALRCAYIVLGCNYELDVKAIVNALPIGMNAQLTFWWQNKIKVVPVSSPGTYTVTGQDSLVPFGKTFVTTDVNIYVGGEYLDFVEGPFDILLGQRRLSPSLSASEPETSTGIFFRVGDGIEVLGTGSGIMPVYRFGSDVPFVPPALEEGPQLPEPNTIILLSVGICLVTLSKAKTRRMLAQYWGR